MRMQNLLEDSVALDLGLRYESLGVFFSVDDIPACSVAHRHDGE